MKSNLKTGCSSPLFRRITDPLGCFLDESLRRFKHRLGNELLNYCCLEVCVQHVLILAATTGKVTGLENWQVLLQHRAEDGRSRCTGGEGQDQNSGNSPLLSGPNPAMPR